MNLQEAVLCVECEWIFDHASHCPRCGCHVIFPVARAMDRRLAAIGGLSQPAPPPPRLVGRPDPRAAVPKGRETSGRLAVTAEPALARIRTA
jgi:hypothetical protein